MLVNSLEWLIAMSFCSVCWLSFWLNSSRTALLPKRLPLISKTDMITKVVFLEFFLKCALFRRCYFYMDQNLQKCSILFRFWRHEVSLIAFLSGILVWSLILPVHLSHRVGQFQLMRFSIAMQLHLVRLCIFQPIFRANTDEDFVLLFLTTNYTVINFFSC